MPYQYPEQLSGNTREDVAVLWDCLWRLVEALNISEETRATLEQKEREDRR